MQELLEERNHWASQPVTPEREQALKAISNSLRELGQGAYEPRQNLHLGHMQDRPEYSLLSRAVHKSNFFSNTIAAIVSSARTVSPS